MYIIITFYTITLFTLLFYTIFQTSKQHSKSVHLALNTKGQKAFGPNKKMDDMIQSVAMKTITTFILATVLGTLAQAQLSSGGLRVGIMDLRGETAKAPLNVQPGSDLSFVYAMPFENERWQFTAEINQIIQQVDRNFGGEPTQFYRASAKATSLQAGLRLYLCNSINRYNPYPGQLLPYIGGTAGLSVSNTTVLSDNLEVPMQVNENTQLAAAGEFNLGLQMVLSQQWRLELYAAGRYTTSDYLDGISGHTEVSDLLARGGMGLFYTF